ncbi:hypothetical protein RirG_073580 [Rhizophagus irregularis DAOM 197198w]|uniref:DUF8211 domain-containing protein n=2 Tax=Rhizophagus irregularis TaxID=588596 RepID=A0A015MYX1_RHIIW|nr:hypothetical protein RirG_073580 [Rhizophagus irregularis DAOM 197198w]
MSYFLRADDFAPAPRYDHTPAGFDDFIFNYDTSRTVPLTEDSLSDTPSFHNNFEDIRPFSSPNKNYIFSTKYEKFHVTPHQRAGYNKIYNFRCSKSFFFELVDHLPNTNQLQLKIYTNDYHMSSIPINHNSTSQLPNFKFQILKQLTHFFSTQKVIPRRLQEKFFTYIRKKLLERLDFIASRAQKKNKNNHMTKTFFNFSYKKYRFYFGIYLPCNHTHTVGPLTNTAATCSIPVPFTMSHYRHACIIHHKKLVLYFLSKDNKIPDVSNCKTFKDFHATRLYNRWVKKKKYQNFSNRLGISFTTSYQAYNTNVVATKGLDFIYGKKYGNLQFTPSSSPKVKKRQEAHFNALVRHTFHNAKLDDNAQTDDKLRAARRYKLLFQENQLFTAPIKHLRYKKKFIEPSTGYYTFPIPLLKIKTVSASAIAETICNVSSVATTLNDNPTSSVNTDNWENVPEHYIPLIPQSAIYEGGLLNQPSCMKIWKKKLQPLAVGSAGWLAHMKEIYDDHSERMEYEQERIIAGIQWDTTPDQGEYRKDLCNLVMEFTDAHYNYAKKLIEMSSEVIPDLPTVSGPLKQSERKKMQKQRLQKFKEIEQKRCEDTEILEDLRSRVDTYENYFVVGYYGNEIGLAFQPCAIMDERLLKRRANDNGNLDTHYSYHKDKKVCILSASKDLGNGPSARTI